MVVTDEQLPETVCSCKRRGKLQQLVAPHLLLQISRHHEIASLPSYIEMKCAVLCLLITDWNQKK